MRQSHLLKTCPHCKASLQPGEAYLGWCGECGNCFWRLPRDHESRSRHTRSDGPAPVPGEWRWVARGMLVKFVALLAGVGGGLAVESRCLHKGGPLADGIVSGKTIVCPLHGWRFDLETGMGVRTSAPACVTTYAAGFVDGVVVVDLTSGAKLGSSADEAA